MREERDRVLTQASANPFAATQDESGKVDLRQFRDAIFFRKPRPFVPEAAELCRRWADLLARKGAALARLGRDDAAREAVQQAVALTEGLLRGDGEPQCPPTSPESVWSFLAGELARQEPSCQYGLACRLALASSLPDHAGRDDPAGRAVQALRGLIVSGFDNAYRLRTPRPDPLRRRPDFGKLVGDLEARVGKKTP